MARQIQTQQVSIEAVEPGDMLLRGNGKYRRVLTNEGLASGERKVRYNPTGGDWFIAGVTVTIKHRDPRCACGCGEQTRGGLWSPGHDGRLAGVGARALSGDTNALRALAAVDPNHLPVGRPSDIEHNPEASCDASCQFAHRSLCVCSCGGTGHFMGWVRIGQLLITEVPEVMPASRLREWGTYSYTEGRRARQHAAVTTGPISQPSWDQHAVNAPNYDEEDLDSYLRRVIPVVTEADEAQGECPMSGQFVEVEGSMTGCPECHRDVKRYSTGRLYRHHRPV